MRIPRIYTDQSLRQGATIALGSAASQHVAKALRMKPGDPLVLFNGEGGEYPARIDAVDRKSVSVAVGEYRERDCESPLVIHLGVAISRGDRMDWVIQKSTELGVASLTPLFSERTEVKLDAGRAQRKLKHWQQVATSACEQCGRNQLPDVHQATTLANWLDSTSADCKFVLHHRADSDPTAVESPASIALLIGPEGGLSPTEISAAEKAGYRALALGPRVLRTETAPLAAIAILQARWGDMRVGN